MLWKYKEENNGMVIREPITEFSPDIIEEAMLKYEEQREKEVILSSFNDGIWILSKQTKRVSINFLSKQERLEEVFEQTGDSYTYFIDRLKIYVLLKLGTCILETLSFLVSTIISETINSMHYTKFTPFRSSLNPSIAEDYLEFVRLISPQASAYTELCDECLQILTEHRNPSEAGNDEARDLVEFESFFIYDEIMHLWWKNVATKTEKAYYYPLYLFWVITTILPLRVNEFCYLPIDCIHHIDEICYLTVRRSTLKGHDIRSPKKHDYTLENDYRLCTYEIPQWLYDELDNYLSSSKDKYRNYNLFFSLEYLYENNPSKRKKPYSNTSVFDSDKLGNLQKSFYRNIITPHYGFILVNETDLSCRCQTETDSYQLLENEIMMIQPCQTRHLAMINLILRGCNPMIIKEFAGHADESMSAHYYTNYSNLIRTTTMRLYEQYQHTESRERFKLNTSLLLIDQDSRYTDVDYGKCYSPEFNNGSSRDCSACSGECRNCRWLIPDKKDRFSNLETKANDEIAFISKLLKNPDIEEYITQYQVEQRRLLKYQSNLASRYWQEGNNG